MTGRTGRLAALSDDQLATMLAELGQSIEYPATPPDLAERVVARLAAAPGPTAAATIGGFRRRFGWFGRAFGDRGYERPRLRRAAILALVALLVLAGLAAAVAFGLPGIRLVFLSPTATPVTASPSAASPTTSPSPPALGPSLAPGHPVTLEDARAAAGFGVEAPTDPSLGVPDAVYLDGTGETARVTLLYGARPGMPPAPGSPASALLTQFRGAVNPDAFVKIIQPGTSVEKVTVEGARGYWIAGRPHQIFYKSGGDTFLEDIRLAGDVLIWEHDGLTFRLETTAGRATALRIAASMR